MPDLRILAISMTINLLFQSFTSIWLGMIILPRSSTPEQWRQSLHHSIYFNPGTGATYFSLH